MKRSTGAPVGVVKRHGATLVLLWTALAVLLVLLGSVGSIVGANEVASSADVRSHNSFVDSSNVIAATLKLSIQREQDLINSTESFLIGNPRATQTSFARWARAVDVLTRYRDVTDLGVIRYITEAELPAYETAMTASLGYPFHVVPTGRRSFYCLAPLGIFRPHTVQLPHNVDLCAGPLGALINGVRSSGRSEVLPYSENGQANIALETPIYASGDVPTTVAARERTFVEIIALTMTPTTIMGAALAGHPDTAVTLRHGARSSAVAFSSGHAPRHAEVANIDLHDGWSIEARGVGSAGGLFESNIAMSVLFGGIALSLLIGAVLFLLGTGRARSMILVGERTEQLQFQALHDSLTGLPNRALIVHRMRQLLERNRRDGTFGAALFVDLDDFKNVNDSLGHEAGDQLLISVASRMKGTLRGVDTIGRMGGDEFVILIDGDRDASTPEAVAQRLLDVMQCPFELEGAATPLIVNASIGIAVGERVSGSELLRDADVALYQAKAAGKNQYVFFSQAMHEDVGRRISLEFDLRSALAEGQFFLVYQPIYRLEDLTIVGAEALLRWRHPSQGVIQPDEFIPILERTGHIREVGAWVLSTACSQMAEWRAHGDQLDISVNVSGRQLDNDHFIDQVRAALNDSGLDVNALIIEVTETALMLDVQAVAERLRTIRDLGVRIAIDDFGTGYSSLSHLREFPIDCIKIDKSFTDTITTSDEARALVRTFIQLGRDLGLKTLAEGVESVDQIDILRASHVNEVQGYLFSRPLEAHILESQLLEPRRPTGRLNPPTLS